MKSHILLSGLLSFLLVPAGAPAGDAGLDEFSAEYNIYTKGIKVAEMQRRFSRLDDGNLSYRSETEASGLVSIFRKDRIIEESIWRFDQGRIIPGHYEYRHIRAKKNRHVNIIFDWEENKVTNLVNDQPWKMPAETGMLDKLLYQYAIMLDLDAGETAISYIIADGGKRKVYDFELIGEEVIETPIGSFQTVKLARNRPDSDRETIFWCAPEIGYLPVKVENTGTNGTKTVGIISSLSGLGF